ncbi:hypothetical protein MRB53_037966 [Persea americana]|nr:hypothetical protein MRB53_037966 [Persea americana]
MVEKTAETCNVMSRQPDCGTSKPQQHPYELRFGTDHMQHSVSIYSSNRSVSKTLATLREKGEIKMCAEPTIGFDHRLTLDSVLNLERSQSETSEDEPRFRFAVPLLLIASVIIVIQTVLALRMM